MSPEPRHLRDWISALFYTLQEAEPHTADGIRRLAGTHLSRMVLDNERVTVRFTEAGLRVARLREGAKLAPPFGATDRQTVSALLFGYIEISEAIALDNIRLRGTADDVMAICAIIEILVDASTRIPALQDLAANFLTTTDRVPLRFEQRARQMKSEGLRKKEMTLLRREGLIG